MAIGTSLPRQTQCHDDHNVPLDKFGCLPKYWVNTQICEVKS